MDPSPTILTAPARGRIPPENRRSPTFAPPRPDHIANPDQRRIAEGPYNTRPRRAPSEARCLVPAPNQTTTAIECSASHHPPLACSPARLFSAQPPRSLPTAQPYHLPLSSRRVASANRPAISKQHRECQRAVGLPSRTASKRTPTIANPSSTALRLTADS
jgi:hypothetical protein